jgi:hypothetical protein
VTNPQDELLRAIAYASPEEVSPAERLKALQMLREHPAAIGGDERLAVDDVDLDRQLDALFVVDVVRAVSEGRVVNGIDPARFPARADALQILLSAARTD